MMKLVQFTWMDYALFGIMFGLSLVVGIYFWLFGKQETTKDYLQGGRKMKVFPVAMSLVASTLSGVSLMAIPAEIYVYGTQCWMMVLSVILAGFIMCFTFLPIFYKLQLTSVFEYLEIRYDKSMRTLFSILYSVTNVILLPILIYAPSLAFNQVTGFNLYLIAAAMSLICIFYTTMGGVKAVVWADTLQLCITLCIFSFVLIKGTIVAGGLSTVWKKAEEEGRIEFFNMDLDPTLRSTFWTVVLGNTAVWLKVLGSSQATMQRFLAVPTYGKSKKILIIYIVVTVVTTSILCFLGLAIYAKYISCDPLTAGFIKRPDQILPYFVADVAEEIPGISGLFICGLFTTALSVLSTALNSISAVLYADIICLFIPSETSEKTNSIILKIITVVTGIITLSLVFVVDKLGTILKITASVYGLCGGPLLGLFLMGMFLPMVNKKGALYGALSSLLFMVVLVVSNQVLVWNGLAQAATKTLHTYGCNANTTESWNTAAFSSTTEHLNAELTTSIITNTAVDDKKPFWLFNISFHYYVLIGTIATIIAGSITSWITKRDDDPAVDVDLLCPLAQRLFKKYSLNHPCQSSDIKFIDKHNELEENLAKLLAK